MASKAQGFLHTPVWYDSTADEVKPIANADGQIPVSLAEAGDALDVHTYGHDGTTWQKLVLLWGYSDRLVDPVSYLVPAPGGYNVFSTAVPPGYVWIVQFVASFNDTTPATHQLFCYDGTTVVPLQNATAMAAALWNTVTHSGITLKEGDKIYLSIGPCAAGDNVYLRLWGYSMKVG